MKKNMTELVFILDASGSMHGLENDTIGGFNSILNRQRELDGLAYVSTVLFNTRSTVLHDRLPLQNVSNMTQNDYRVGGGTALLDAIGNAIRHIETIHKYARPEDVPEHTLFFITTDGMENASQQYSHSAIKQMIRKHEEMDGWEFLFVAANIDATAAAQEIGIRAERAANYQSTSKGTHRLYDTVNAAISELRCNAYIQRDWADNLSE